MTDNIAVLQGFTQEVVADSDSYTLYLLVRPDTDFDSTFEAWDTDSQEYLRINGWLFTITPAADY
jgi:hypothetical protein